jgi:hypothetical protein
MAHLEDSDLHLIEDRRQLVRLRRKFVRCQKIQVKIRNDLRAFY